MNSTHRARNRSRHVTTRIGSMSTRSERHAITPACAAHAADPVNRADLVIDKGLNPLGSNNAAGNSPGMIRRRPRRRFQWDPSNQDHLMLLSGSISEARPSSQGTVRDREGPHEYDPTT
jgi:hypothetical protein